MLISVPCVWSSSFQSSPSIILLSMWAIKTYYSKFALLKGLQAISPETLDILPTFQLKHKMAISRCLRCKQFDCEHIKSSKLFIRVRKDLNFSLVRDHVNHQFTCPWTRCQQRDCDGDEMTNHVRICNYRPDNLKPRYLGDTCWGCL